MKLGETNVGRYDGLYLSGGFPYAVLEAKRYKNDLTDADFAQARSYATSESFDYPVPFLVVSNGRQHHFYKRTETIDPADGKLLYQPIPATSWSAFKEEKPGEVRRLLGEKELLAILLGFKLQTVKDISARFVDASIARGGQK